MVQTKPQDITPRSLARKRTILLEASKAFREKGFHATGMRDIAARLDVTVGSLYYYFNNKEELLIFCQEDTLLRLESYVAWIDDLGLRPDTRLHALISSHVACLNVGTRGSLAHLEVPESDTPENRALLRKRSHYRRVLGEVIEEGIQRGILETPEPRLAVMAILGAVNWTVRWYQAKGDRSPREIGESFADQLVQGLLAPGIKLERPVLQWPGFELAAPSVPSLESANLDKGMDDD
ncbi:MAG: TetR/AcrR family transcriptional regulator [Planctomycetota bacterium]